MKISLRMVFTLISGLTVAVLAFSLYQVLDDRAKLISAMDHQTSLINEVLRSHGRSVLASPDVRTLEMVSEKFQNQDVLGLAIFNQALKQVAMTHDLQSRVGSLPADYLPVRRFRSHGFDKLPDGQRIYISSAPLQEARGLSGVLVAVYDARPFDLRLGATLKMHFLRLFTYALMVAFATMLLFRWSMKDPMKETANWIRDLRLGTHDGTSPPIPARMFGPLTTEVTRMAQSLHSARASAEEEAKLRHSAESLWTPERLKEFVRTKLQDRVLFVVSNREPYVHEHKGRDIKCSMPASGLVTALEPILRACGGTWVAQGSGDADRETTGPDDTLRVPPDDPAYTLRRVWLTEEEERGYYYGFANEGLWPLCHLAHNRPIFKPEDWSYYQSVNQKFADALLEEMEGVEQPLVLVQDYHFALLPRIIKERRPDARIALFWHIPWPNPEAFRICPWQKQLLHGMLGADLIGFHIQYHCNNFLETVDLSLESRIDHETFSVNRRGHTTAVKPFPISVAAASVAKPGSPTATKAELFNELGVKAKYLGVGVDRIDYTKGIEERFRAIERLLEKYPEFAGQFTFVELGAPSRTFIKRYHDLMDEVDTEVARINGRFATEQWKPIVFLKKQHSHAEIERYYKCADLCLVTSLHDGMNLVAKEFIAARDSADGALILSCFAGASRELPDALIVNPYDIDQTAEAIKNGLLMSPEEMEARMGRMQQAVRENNIYKWGANLITELTQLRSQNVALPV